MNMLAKILAKMAEEYGRLDDFIKKYNDREDHPSNEDARLETPKVVILTKNHGYFVLDEQDIVRALELRRDSFKKDMENRTFLGEDVSKLRPGDAATG